MSNKPVSLRIAVIGSGVAGLSAAWHLCRQTSIAPLDICLFEKDERLGGHANTVRVNLDGISAPVDTGFLVCNERTYPLFIPFLNEINIPLAATDMSFAVSVGPHDFEWSGSSLAGLFAQPKNMLSPRFWMMLKDILRFNKEATRLAQWLETDAPSDLQMPLGEFLAKHRFGTAFRDDYLVPMAAAIWSCPTKTMLTFPMGSFVRFFNNHGLLQITNRPRWFTIDGGSKKYVDKIAETLSSAGGTIRLNASVNAIRRTTNGILLEYNGTTERFDHVVLATHTDQAQQLIQDIRPNEASVLSSIAYQSNAAYLHTDLSLMPKSRNAWAAWNYLSKTRGTDQEQSVSVTYWLNKLQPLPFTTPVFVSLNPISEPDPSKVIQRFNYSHPVFDLRSTKAQQALPTLQGQQNTWFAGAWTGYGFHEDGFRSGKLVADSLLRAQGQLTKSQAMAA
jgi:uncharacterized protein